MAKAPKFTHESFKDDGAAIGQVGDDIDIFPESELPERIAKMKQEEEVLERAIAESEGEDLDDISDLDD